MSKRRILIVDDEQVFARLLKLNLERTGCYEVATEARGREALGAAQAFRPDLILLDVIMPDLNGKEVAKQLEATPALRRVPIVFVTAAVSRDELADDPQPLGRHACLAKPVRLEEVLNCIEQHFNGSPAVDAAPAA